MADLIRSRPFDQVRVLCHYTTAEGLLGILQSQSLWATNIAYLNDSKEYQHSLDVFLHVVRQLKEFQHRKENEDGVILMRALEDRARGANRVQPVWVTCFSERPDDLGQWRGYGQGEGGYAICFNPAMLALAASGNPRTTLLPCNYDLALHVASVQKVLGTINEVFADLMRTKAPTTKVEDLLGEFVECVAWNLHYLAPIIKHPAFAEEREWRFVHHTVLGDYSEINFRPAQTTLTGYVELQVRSPRPDDNPLPIIGIVVGPSRHKDLSVVSVRALLAKLGYKGVEVIESLIPYRVT